MAFNIGFYEESYEQKWDDFVLNNSINGTFLQTRKFLNYHKEGKFIDCSLMIKKGDQIVGAVPACKVIDDDGKTLFMSHRGSTFGGIILSNKVYSASNVQEIIILVEDFLRENGFERVYFKMTCDLYTKDNSVLLDYFFYQRGYTQYNELNYYLDLSTYQKDILAQFSSSKRRDYRYSLKNNLQFKVLETKEEILEFYNVLQLNLRKLGLNSVHSYEDLLDLKFNRFDKEIDFYGVYLEDKMIAGSMTFTFDDVLHTQYLSSDEEYLKLFPMDFLIYNLIDTAVKNNKRLFTFGICTENQGKYLNIGLSRFKEGFGCQFTLNNSYEKDL